MVDQEVMKGPHTPDTTETKKTTCLERESKFARVKRMLTCQTTTRVPLTYEEAKVSVKARKRKERQESITSISQERKVIRSNSEERPITKKKEDIRRVSSHEDFQKTQHHQPLQNHNENIALLAIQDGPMKIIPHRDINIDDGEFEQRRSHERFQKPLVQRGRHNYQGRKPKSKTFTKTTKDKHHHRASENGKISNHKHNLVEEATETLENPDACNFLKLVEDKERSPSPVHTPASPALDLTTLHQQIDCSEPIPSNTNRNDATETLPSLSIASNRLLSSPRNSVIITERIYLNPDVPQNNLLGKDPKNPVEQRLKQLAKQINNLKKKIKKYEDDFQNFNGYRPSHADKLNDKNIKKLCTELTKLKKEQRQLQEDSTSVLNSNTIGFDLKRSVLLLQETIFEIEKRLSSKRLFSERSSTIEELSGEQLMDEKIAVQKALLYLESIHGRPTTRDDKDLARPLYDRYRTLKRMVGRLAMTSSIIELATIHEHETMDFVSLPTTQNATNVIIETDSEKQQIITTGSTDSDTDTSIGENLHELSLEELINEHRNINEEKKQLRRSLKEFEADFEMRTGRKLQKEDSKAPMENIYTSYKKAKAKLRLIDALVGKQAAP